MTPPIQKVLRDRAADGHVASSTLIEAADYIDYLEQEVDRRIEFEDGLFGEIDNLRHELSMMIELSNDPD